MPQQTFRQPSSSVLDRTRSDPVASDITPKISLKWKKDSKLSKDLVCFHSGRTTNPDGTRKKGKEPDITMAIFQHLKELTLYEPNLQRVEMEDLKGFEVVLLLGAVVIRDVYFTRMTESFNISDPPRQNVNDTPTGRPQCTAHATPSRPSVNGPTPNPNRPAQSTRPSRVPPTDPRSQWEIDAETARLKKQAEAEERERQHREAAEQNQIKRMLEAEEREKRRKQAEVDKETERLKRLYGQDQANVEANLRPPKPPARHNGPQRYSAPHIPTVPEGSVPQQHPGYQHTQSHSFAPPPGSYQPYIGGPYLQGPATGASQSGFFGTPNGGAGPSRLKEKKSFFGFNRARSVVYDDEDAGGRLHKKKSSMF